MFNEYYRQEILPIAKKELLYWYKKADKIFDHRSRQFIKNCLKTKTLHPLGASVYTVSLPKKSQKNIAWYVCFQILADLLDSESERKEINPNLVKQMHYLLFDFIEGGKIIKKHYPQQKKILLDINYLQLLVKKGEGLNFLPNYQFIKPYLLDSLKRYSKAQFNSSMRTEIRDEANKKWAKQYHAKKHGLRWFEYYASQASTLPIFALMTLSAQKNLNPKTIKIIYESHYSWFPLLHIMLNHLAGMEEDKRLNTINYISYYGNKNQIKKRLLKIFQKTKTDLRHLPNANFYLFILYILIKKYTNYRYKSKWHGISKTLKKEAEDLKSFL